MGQSVSVPKPQEDVAAFLNLPKDAIYSLWTSYNLLGEGWGLNIHELISIFRGADFLAENYGFKDAQLKALFTVFDTDSNGLIDALEIFVTIALASGMDTIDKIYFAFSAYDFDSSGSLSYDEATLLLRSVVKGLSKLSPSCTIFSEPTTKEIEKFAELVFQHSNKDIKSGKERITVNEFRQYCSFHPVTSSWLKSVAQFPSAEEDDSKNNKDDISPEEASAMAVAALKSVQGMSVKRARRPIEDSSIISELDYVYIESKRAAEAAAIAKRLAAIQEALEAKKRRRRKRGGDDDEEEEEEVEEDEEEEVSLEAKAAAAAAAEAAAEAEARAADPHAPPIPSWLRAVDLMKPEELPESIRYDPPEDLFEPVWITGINTSRPMVAEPATNLALASAPQVLGCLMHRCVRYQDMTLPPVKALAEEDEESDDAAVVAPPTALLATAATQLLSMKKSEEAGWSQVCYNQHGATTAASSNSSSSSCGSPITCMDVHYGKGIVVTADNSGRDNLSTGGKIIVWNLQNFAVLCTFTTKYGVKLLDISDNGVYLLVIAADLASTAAVYELATGRIVFAKPMLIGARTVKDCVLDARFTGTSSMFAVASAIEGMTYFIEEGGSDCGSTTAVATVPAVQSEEGETAAAAAGEKASSSNNSGSSSCSSGGVLLKVYEPRTALYQAAGRAAKGVAVTELCRFEHAEELIAGTAKGQIMLWRGRTCAQLIAAHNAAISALDYNATNRTLITGSSDGTINLFTIAAAAVTSVADAAKKGPRIIVPRLLQLSATLDILRHGDLCSHSIRSLSLSADATRALLSTAASEVMEIALYVRPPTAEELAEAEAAAEALAAAAEAAAANVDGGDDDTAAAAAAALMEELGGGGVPVNKGLLGDDLHGGAILSAHAPTTTGVSAEITGLCRIPLGGFASCGADGTVRWWQSGNGEEDSGGGGDAGSTAVYRATKVIRMDSGCQAIDASSSLIAVALSGGAIGNIRNVSSTSSSTTTSPLARTGSIHLFSIPDMKFVMEFQLPATASGGRPSINDMKFSPEGNLLVIAASDGFVYVYQQQQSNAAIDNGGDEAAAGGGDWALKGACGAVSKSGSGGGGAATKLDFSSDGMYVRCYYPASTIFRLYDVGSAVYNNTNAVAAASSEGEDEAAAAAVTISNFGKDIADVSVYDAAIAAAKLAAATARAARRNADDDDDGGGDDAAIAEAGPPYDLLRNLTWATNSCAHNWDTKGTWALSMPQQQLVQPADCATAGRSDRYNHLLITATSTGTIVVDRVPAPQYRYRPVVTPPTITAVPSAQSLVISDKQQPARQPPAVSYYTAHLGSIASVLFIEEGAKLVTVGAADGTLRVWKVTYDLEEYEPDPASAAENEGDIGVNIGEGDEEGKESIEEEEEELDEDGKPKPKLAPVYDSGEDDDLIDTYRMKEHLSRKNVLKRRTFKIQADADAAKAADEAMRNAVAAISAVAENMDEAVGETAAEGVTETGALAVLDAPAKSASSLDFEVHEYSGTKNWGAYLGFMQDNMAIDATKILSAPHSLLPTDELHLNWVYGCSTRNTRGSVRYSKEGKIVYPAGTMAVLYDKLKHSQQHCMPHVDEISCMDVHTTAGLAVTAHKGSGRIAACIWRTADAKIIRYLDCSTTEDVYEDMNGVSAIAFSPDAAYVALTCQDTEHTVMVFSVNDGRLCASYKNGPKKPLCISFSLGVSIINTAVSTETTTPAFAAGTTPVKPMRIIVGGVLHFKFLTFYPDRSALYGKTGAYGADVPKSNALCVASLPIQPVAAAEDGNGGEEASGNEYALGMADGTVGLVTVGESKVSNFVPVHKGAVTAICVVVSKAGSLEEAPVYRIVTGGVHGAIKVLDQELQPLSEFNLYLTDYGLLPLGRVRGFKSLCVDKLKRKILYATAGGEIGEILLESGVDVNKGPLVSAHSRDQLHALCAHPLRQECLTAGDDKSLRIWDLEKRHMFTSIELPDIARTATFSPNGHLIIAGLGGNVPRKGKTLTTPRPHAGSVVVISYLQGILRIVHTAKDARATITSVVFTPDGSKLLAASLDGNVYMYDALNNFMLIVTLTGQHKEGIRSMDMSSSGRYLATTGVYNEFYLWDLGILGPVASKDEAIEALAEVGLDWHVKQSPFGLSTIGIFPPYSDPSDILTIHQSNDHKLLAAGDSFGALKLFRNPSTEYFAPHKQYFSHSPGGISKVSFTVSDKYLLSTGRTDRVLAQWSVLKSSYLPDADLSSDAVLAEAAKIVHEENYSASFTIKGVPFVLGSNNESAEKFASGPALKAHLRSIVGTGAVASKTNSNVNVLPRVCYFGQDDLLACAGRVPILLDGSGSGMQRPLWTPLPSSSSSSSSSWQRYQYHNNPNQQQISVFAVSPNAKYALIGYHSGGSIHSNGCSSISANSSADSSSSGGRLVMLGAPSGHLVAELSNNLGGVGAIAVCFSEDGNLCACLSGDVQHTLQVYVTYSGSWEDVMLLSTAMVSAGDISLLSFISGTGSSASAISDNYTAPVLENNIESIVDGEDAENLLVPSSPVQRPATTTASTRVASGGGPYDLVTAGEGHIKFWRIQGLNLYCTCGIYISELAVSKPQYTSITSYALPTSNNDSKSGSWVVCGDAQGSIHMWQNSKQECKLDASHFGAITALKTYGGNNNNTVATSTKRKSKTQQQQSPPIGFISGSYDRLIIWIAASDTRPVPLQTVTVATILSACGWSSALYLADQSSGGDGINSVVRSTLNSNFITSIDCDARCQRVVIAFASSTVVTLTTDSRTVLKLSEGHGNSAISKLGNSNSISLDANGKVTGLLSLPNMNDTVLTFSTDGLLRIWEIGACTVQGQQQRRSKKDTKETKATAATENSTGMNNLAGVLQLAHPPTAAVFLNATTLLVAVEGTDTKGKSSSVLVIDITRYRSGSSSEPRYTIKIIGRMHNVGSGAIRQLKISPQWKYLAACSEDGCAYVYSIQGVDARTGAIGAVAGLSRTASSNKNGNTLSRTTSAVAEPLEEDMTETLFIPVGFLLAHPHAAPVAGLDFSDNNRYVRTFGENHAGSNGKIEVNFFDFELKPGASGSGKNTTTTAAPVAVATGGSDAVRAHAAGKVQDPLVIETLRTVKWASISSPAVVEVRGISYTHSSKSMTEAAKRPIASANQLTQVHSMALNTTSSGGSGGVLGTLPQQGNTLVCATYEDGSARVYRYPILDVVDTSNNKAMLELKLHSSGPVLATFTSSNALQQQLLVTVGQSDGAMMVWAIDDA